MIDVRILRDQPDLVRNSQNARGYDPSLVDDALVADQQRKAALAKFESLRAEQKQFGKKVAAAKGDEKAQLLSDVKTLAEDVKQAQRLADEAAERVDACLRQIPNIVIDGAPSGGEENSQVIRTEGTPRDFDAEGFTPKDHLELAEKFDGIDTARGAKVSGSRFHFFRGNGARLQQALTQYAIDQAIGWGMELMIPPTLVRPEIMEGTGFLGEHASEVYRLEADDLYLVGTSEVSLAGFFADEIIDLSNGPIRFVGLSTCYRREAGSHGKDTRGIIRVHQFTKAEMFCLTKQEDAEAEHAQLLAWEEQLLQALKLPYHVLDVAAGDLGSSAGRKFDCEAWVPTQGTYRELTSTSNCTTFQSRRLNIRERTEHGTRPVATLNGTLTTDRWLVALLENYQQADGSVQVPEVLQPYLGGLKVL